jgi:hypothetical protein
MKGFIVLNNQKTVIENGLISIKTDKLSQGIYLIRIQEENKLFIGRFQKK